LIDRYREFNYLKKVKNYNPVASSLTLYIYASYVRNSIINYLNKFVYDQMTIYE